jgi:hypothetical protein
LSPSGCREDDQHQSAREHERLHREMTVDREIVDGGAADAREHVAREAS